MNEQNLGPRDQFSQLQQETTTRLTALASRALSPSQARAAAEEVVDQYAEMLNRILGVDEEFQSHLRAPEAGLAELFGDEALEVAEETHKDHLQVREFVVSDINLVLANGHVHLIPRIVEHMLLEYLTQTAVGVGVDQFNFLMALPDRGEAPTRADAEQLVDALSFAGAEAQLQCFAFASLPSLVGSQEQAAAHFQDRSDEILAARDGLVDCLDGVSDADLQSAIESAREAMSDGPANRPGPYAWETSQLFEELVEFSLARRF